MDLPDIAAVARVEMVSLVAVASLDRAMTVGDPKWEYVAGECSSHSGRNMIRNRCWTRVENSRDMKRKQKH
jgi:hypothetical protein